MHDSHQAFNELLRGIMTHSVPEGLRALLRGLWPIIPVVIILLFIKERIRRSERERAQRARRVERDNEYRRMAKLLREENEKTSRRDE